MQIIGTVRYVVVFWTELYVTVITVEFDALLHIRKEIVNPIDDISQLGESNASCPFKNHNPES